MSRMETPGPTRAPLLWPRRQRETVQKFIELRVEGWSFVRSGGADSGVVATNLAERNGSVLTIVNSAGHRFLSLPRRELRHGERDAFLLQNLEPRERRHHRRRPPRVQVLQIGRRQFH